MNILKLYKKENWSLRIAIGILLGRDFKKGDQIGFNIKRKHYIIKRDK